MFYRPISAQLVDGLSYDACALNKDVEASSARKDKVAEKLYRKYHFDEKVREIGRKPHEFKI